MDTDSLAEEERLKRLTVERQLVEQFATEHSLRQQITVLQATVQRLEDQLDDERKQNAEQQAQMQRQFREFVGARRGGAGAESEAEASTNATGRGARRPAQAGQDAPLDSHGLAQLAQEERARSLTSSAAAPATTVVVTLAPAPSAATVGRGSISHVQQQDLQDFVQEEH